MEIRVGGPAIILPDACIGTVTWPGGEVRCALGWAGVRLDKREGDGATPIGCFPLRRLFYRPDRLSAPETGLPVAALTPDDGWCDDSKDTNYNRPVRLPYSGGHERMWRDDALYDVVVVLGHNDDPPQPDFGSAIFLHVARSGYAPTEGCVALALSDLLRLIVDCDQNTVLRIGC